MKVSSIAGVADWLVESSSRVLDRRLSRRSFVSKATMVGTAVAATGCAVVTQPGAPYTFVTDCGGGSLCRDGYTEFCCVINQGVNACPPNTIASGWWRADYSVFCGGTRYYIDCNNYDGAGPCRCAAGCGTRKVYCNHFRYGQCNQWIGGTGVIACRMVTCVPPYALDLGCTPSGAVDNATAGHNADCAAFTPPPAPAEVSVGDAVSSAADEMALVTRSSSGEILLRTASAGTFATWEGLGGIAASRVVLRAFGGDLFALVRGTDRAIFANVFQAGSWSGWDSIGAGALTSDPAVVVDGSRLLVFARGTDNALYWNRFESGGWSGWASLGGGIASDPVAVSDGARVAVFIRGTNYAIYANVLDAGSWSGWVGLGGAAASDPAAVWDGSRFLVFVRGTDFALHWNRLEAGLWTGWTSLGGGLTSDPAVLVEGPRTWVFARGTDNALYANHLEAGTWSGFANQGGGLASNPLPVFDGARLFVFIRGTDGALWVNVRDGGSWSGWVPLGGSLALVRGVD
jgi:hypothetical protein